MVTKGEMFRAVSLFVQDYLSIATVGQILIAGLRGGEITESYIHISATGDFLQLTS